MIHLRTMTRDGLKCSNFHNGCSSIKCFNASKRFRVQFKNLLYLRAARPTCGAHISNENIRFECSNRRFFIFENTIQIHLYWCLILIFLFDFLYFWTTFTLKRTGTSIDNRSGVHIYIFVCWNYE